MTELLHYGGSYVLFADRLPKATAAAWTQAYDAYQSLWKQQSAGIQTLPVHFGAKFWVGLPGPPSGPATQELDQYLDKCWSCSAHPL